MQRMTEDEFSARVSWCHKGKADRHTQDRIAKEARRARASEGQKDAMIKTLADSLEGMTHVAMGLHLIYRRGRTIDSDGSHEKAFADALALVKKARAS